MTTSTLLSRSFLSKLMAWGFNGRRDYNQVLGYPDSITSEMMYALYERRGISGRAVNSAPEATWSSLPEVKGNEKVAELLQLLGRRHNLWGNIMQADRLCAFDRFSVVLFGLPGKSETPAPKLKSVDDIKYVRSYGAGSVTVYKYDPDRGSERYGQPELYKIQVTVAALQQASTTAMATASIDLIVHWTRVLHVVDNPLQGNLFGIPRMVPIYNTLLDLQKVTGSGAENFWLTANRGMQVDIDKDMSLQKGDAEALSAELDEYQHQLRRFIRTRGVKINNLGSNVPDPGNTFEMLISELAAATNIPQRMLLGAEAGQLASAQDRANWADYIDRRYKLFAEPYVMLPLLRLFERLGLVEAQASESVEYKWVSAFKQNPLEDSQTMSAKARALINLSRQSQYGTPYVGMKEGRVWLGLPPELPSDDELPMAKATANGTAAGTAKQGGSKATGGAGGNDGSGNSGGGASNDPNAPSGDAASAPGTQN